MADIIPLTTISKEPDDQIWCCVHCDSSSFSLFSDGTTECRGCGYRGCGYRGEYPEGRWGEWTPIDDKKPKVQRSTAVYDGAEFAQKAIIKSLDEDAAILIVAWPGGKLRAWSRFGAASTPEEKATVRYLTAQATSLILGEAPLDRPDDVLEQTE